MRIPASQHGFTLVEIIVSMMIFSIVVVVALAALVKIIDANKKAQTTQDAVIGLSFALESISRELRTGSKLHCEANSSGAFTPPADMDTVVNSCLVGHNNLIVFQSTRMDASATPQPCRLLNAYLIKGTGSTNDPYVLTKAVQSTGNNCTQSFASDSYVPIVPSNVTLSDYRLGLAYDINNPFPRAFISLSGYAGQLEKVRTYFTVQTGASPRIP